jgi:hypothetical protein
MYNTECTFDKAGNIKFTEMKWFIPIQAINMVKLIEVKDKKIELKIFTDLNV